MRIWAPEGNAKHAGLNISPRWKRTGGGHMGYVWYALCAVGWVVQVGDRRSSTGSGFDPQKAMPSMLIHLWCQVNPSLQSSQIWECDTEMRGNAIKIECKPKPKLDQIWGWWSNIRYTIKKSDELWLVGTIRTMLQQIHSDTKLVGNFYDIQWNKRTIYLLSSLQWLKPLRSINLTEYKTYKVITLKVIIKNTK